LYQKGEITVGSILAIFMYSKYLLNVVRGILENINSFVEKFVLVGDTELLISHTPENYFKGKKRVDIQGEVEFINVSFGYEQEQNPLDIKKENSNSKILSVGSLSHKDNKGDSRAQLYESKDLKTQQNKSKLSLKKTFSLSNINLKINKGSKVAFVGESGGGKSTSIELVGGFYFPNKGEVLVDGVSTKDINLNDLRSSIAYVSQDIAIFNTTIGENISYGLNKDLKDEKEIEEKIKKAAKQANIAEFISSLPEGYSTEVGEKGLKLSGGQKQRIAIARAILRDPKILILDEPTSALDIESETKITKALENVMKGRTTIIIAHRISTVRDADKIFVFKEGQIVQSGTYKNLASTDGEFKKMVELHEGIE
jgi:ABC-type multidrug transport system fused ATPase/permease subunit